MGRVAPREDIDVDPVLPRYDGSGQVRDCRGNFRRLGNPIRQVRNVSFDIVRAFAWVEVRKAQAGPGSIVRRVERIKAARGTTLRCTGWRQEAILRMLENNLENAEKPDELIIYGGTGKAARNWDAFHRIVETLKSLRDDETLVVQSGKPVAVFETDWDAPRVLIANAHLVPRWSNCETFHELEKLGLPRYG